MVGAHKQSPHTLTVVVAPNLAGAVVAYLVSQYVVLALLVRFNAGESADYLDTHAGGFPFRHTSQQFAPGNDKIRAAPFVSSILSYIVASLFLMYRLTSGVIVWDYVISLFAINFALTCMVSGEAPSNWVWWVTHIVCVGLSILCVWLWITFRQNRKSAKRMMFLSGR